MYRPLADEIRPLTLDEVYGQKHILGENGLLRRIIASGNVPNMIFYGPSGSGKTTVANIIAKETNRELRRLNATTASLSDVKDIIAELDSLLVQQRVKTLGDLDIADAAVLLDDKAADDPPLNTTIG